MKILKHHNKVKQTPVVKQSTLPLINEIGEPILDKYGKKTFVKQLERDVQVENVLFYDLEVNGEKLLSVHQDTLVNSFKEHNVTEALYEYWSELTS